MPTIQKGRRLLVISDVGGAENRHIGDEAMLEANLAALRNLIPEVVFTIVSRDPAWTELPTIGEMLAATSRGSDERNMLRQPPSASFQD